MRQPSRRPAAVLLCCLTVLSGCYNTQPLTLPTGGGPATLAAGQPVRVRLADGSQFTLSNAQVIGDSLVGQADAPSRRFAVALADVRAVEQHELSKGRTAAATGAGMVFLVVGAGLLAIAALVSSL
jgi:hypothetical protein